MFNKLLGFIKGAINLAQSNTHARSGGIKTKIAGVTHENRQQLLLKCRKGQKIVIVNEPMKKYPHAMAVYAVNRKDGKKLGYLNNELAQDVFEDHRHGNEIIGKILDITGGTRDKPAIGCNIEFYVD